MKLKKENLIAHEIMGLNVIILDKKGEEMQRGIIYDETKETIKVKSDKIKTYLKRSNDFVFIINDERIKIKGNYLLGRPEERIRRI